MLTKPVLLGSALLLSASFTPSVAGEISNPAPAFMTLSHVDGASPLTPFQAQRIRGRSGKPEFHWFTMPNGSRVHLPQPAIDALSGNPHNQ